MHGAGGARTGTVSIFNIFLLNQHLHDPRVGSQKGITEAAESLIAQLDSKSKRATPRRENRKILHGNEI
jgi:hypothetical protein